MRAVIKEDEGGSCLKWVTLEHDDGSYFAHIAIMDHGDEVIVYVTGLTVKDIEKIKISKEVKKSE